MRALGSRGGKDGYAELSGIYDELDEVSGLQRRLGCPSIDTTSLALEEAAGRVIDLVDDRRRVAAGTTMTARADRADPRPLAPTRRTR